MMFPLDNEEKFSIKFPQLVTQNPKVDSPSFEQTGRDLTEAEVSKKIDYPFWETMTDMWKKGYVGEQFKKTYYDLQATIAGGLAPVTSFIRGEEYGKVTKQVSDYYISESARTREQITNILSQQVPDDRLDIFDRVQKSVAIAIGNAPAVISELVAVNAVKPVIGMAYFVSKNLSDGFVRASVDLERNFPGDEGNYSKAMMKGTVDGIVGGLMDYGGTKLISNPLLKNSINQSLGKYASSIGLNIGENFSERLADEMLDISPDRDEFSREEITEAFFNEVLPNVFTTTTKVANDIRLKRLSNQFDGQRKKTVMDIEGKIGGLDSSTDKDAPSRIAELQDKKFFAEHLNEPTTFQKFSNGFWDKKFKGLSTLINYTDDDFNKVLNKTISDKSFTLSQEWIGKTTGFYELERLIPRETWNKPQEIKKIFGLINDIVGSQDQAQSAGGVLLGRLLNGDELVVNKERINTRTDIEVDPINKTVDTTTHATEKYHPRTVTFQKSNTTANMETILKTLSREDGELYTKWVIETIDDPQNARKITDLPKLQQDLHNELTRIKLNVAEYLKERGVFTVDDQTKFLQNPFLPSGVREKSVGGVKKSLLESHYKKIKDSVGEYDLVPSFIKTIGDAINAGEVNNNIRNNLNRMADFQSSLQMRGLIREGGNELGNTLSVMDGGLQKKYVVNNIPLFNAIRQVESEPLPRWAAPLTGLSSLARKTITNMPLLSIPFKVSMTLKDALQTLSQRPSALLKYPSSIGKNIKDAWTNELFDNEFSKQFLIGGGKYSGTRYDWNERVRDYEQMEKTKSFMSGLMDRLPGGLLAKKTWNVINLDWTEDISRTARAYAALDSEVGKEKKAELGRLEASIKTARESGDAEKEKIKLAEYNELKKMNKSVDIFEKLDDQAKSRVLDISVDESKRVTRLDRRGAGNLVKVLTSSIPFTNPMLQSSYEFYRESKNIINGTASPRVTQEFVLGASLSLAAGVLAGFNEDAEDDTDQKLTTRSKWGDFVFPTGFPVTQLFINSGRAMGHTLKAGWDGLTDDERKKQRDAGEKLIGSMPMTVMNSYAGKVGLESAPSFATLLRLGGIDKNWNKYKQNLPTHATDLRSTSTPKDISKLIWNLSGGDIDIPPRQIDELMSGLLTTVYRVGKSAYEGLTDRSEQSIGEVIGDMLGYAMFKYKPTRMSQEMLDWWQEKSEKMYFSNIEKSYMDSNFSSAFIDYIADQYNITPPKIKISKNTMEHMTKMLSDETFLTEKKLEEISVNDDSVKEVLWHMKMTTDGIQMIREDQSKTPDQKKQLIESAIKQLRVYEQQMVDFAELIFSSTGTKKP